jgi:hypothetical protein
VIPPVSIRVAANKARWNHANLGKSQKLFYVIDFTSQFLQPLERRAVKNR